MAIIKPGKFYLVGFNFLISHLLILILVYRKMWQERKELCKIYDWKKFPFFFLLIIIGCNNVSVNRVSNLPLPLNGERHC